MSRLQACQILVPAAKVDISKLITEGQESEEEEVSPRTVPSRRLLPLPTSRDPPPHHHIQAVAAPSPQHSHPHPPLGPTVPGVHNQLPPPTLLPAAPLMTSTTSMQHPQPPPPIPQPQHGKRSLQADSPAKRQSKWSQEEDALIIELRAKHMKWEDISRHLPGRSPISCRLHYQNYLERRSEWDDERKNKLARLYERFKPEMWAKVAEEMAVPWRAAEAMHWKIGEQDMARRAGVTPFLLDPHTSNQSRSGSTRYQNSPGPQVSGSKSSYRAHPATPSRPMHMPVNAPYSPHSPPGQDHHYPSGPPPPMAGYTPSHPPSGYPHHYPPQHPPSYLQQHHQPHASWSHSRHGSLSSAAPNAHPSLPPPPMSPSRSNSHTLPPPHVPLYRGSPPYDSSVTSHHLRPPPPPPGPAYPEPPTSLPPLNMSAALSSSSAAAKSQGRLPSLTEALASTGVDPGSIPAFQHHGPHQHQHHHYNHHSLSQVHSDSHSHSQPHPDHQYHHAPPPPPPPQTNHGTSGEHYPNRGSRSPPDWQYHQQHQQQQHPSHPLPASQPPSANYHPHSQPQAPPPPAAAPDISHSMRSGGSASSEPYRPGTGKRRASPELERDATRRRYGPIEGGRRTL